MKKIWIGSVGLIAALIGCGRTLPSQEGSQFKSYSHEEQEGSWKSFFSRAQPSKAEMREYFLEAAKEFDVPAELLMAIGQVETNWTQIGPGVDYGWGVMHLVENPYMDTLGSAAKLLGASRDALKDDPRQNIRGAAALLADAMDRQGGASNKVEDWFPAAMALSGMATPALRFEQAKTYFKTMREGVVAPTYFGDEVVLEPQGNVAMPMENENGVAAAPDYAAAEDKISPCNFAKGRRGISIDTWVNHWIGVGTMNGAISWFHNCERDPGSSAHFIVGNDGRVVQIVRVEDTAWHSGSKTFKDNKERAIGVEHEVTSTHPDTWHNEALLKASTDLARHFIDRFGIQRVRRIDGQDDPKAGGIRGHDDMPGTATDCPGPLPWDKWMSLLNSDGAPAPEPTGALVGVTYEGSDTTKRLAGVKVTLSDGSVTTSSESGVYRFNGLKAGAYTVKAEKDGFKAAERQIEVKAGVENWGSLSLTP